MKIFVRQLVIPFLLFLFSACGENKSDVKSDSLISKTDSANSSANQKPISVPPRKITANELACFYALNDKDARTPKPEILSAWLVSFLDSVNGNDIDSEKNLFNNGGGPMGAQMNPNADLLFTAFFTGTVDTSSLVFKMNDFPVLKNKIGINKRLNDGITICWFAVPKNRFTVMLHLASDNEVKEICAIKQMETTSWIKNSCTAIKISAEAKVDGKDVALQNYFLANFTQ